MPDIVFLYECVFLVLPIAPASSIMLVSMVRSIMKVFRKSGSEVVKDLFSHHWVFLWPLPMIQGLRPTVSIVRYLWYCNFRYVKCYCSFLDWYIIHLTAYSDVGICIWCTQLIVAIEMHVLETDGSWLISSGRTRDNLSFVHWFSPNLSIKKQMLWKWTYLQSNISIAYSLSMENTTVTNRC